MRVAQIQQSQVGLNRFYSKRQFGVKNNQSQIAVGKDTLSRQTQPNSIDGLKATQTNLKNQISIMLQTETNPKKIKKLKNYQKVLDVLLEKEKTPFVSTIKKTPVVAFGNAAQKAEARKAVHTFAATAAGFAASLAQAPGVDEVVLAGNDALMAISVCSCYDLTLTKSLAKVVVAPIAGNAMGIKLFSKALTWFPGAGNALNAGVAASVTEFVGNSLIRMCESGEMQKAIKKLLEKNK